VTKAQLKKKISQKDEQISLLEAKKKDLEHRLNKLEKMIFGATSERHVSNHHPDQLELFEVQEQEPIEQPIEQITYTRKKSKSKHPGRNPFPDHLPVKIVRIVPDCDTSQMTLLKELISESLEYNPARLYIKRTIRPVYASKDEDKIIVGKLPSRPLPKSIAESSLLTHIIISKFIDHLPFYRQIKMFERDFDWQVSSSTVNDWFIAVCNLLEPLYNKLKEKILENDYIQVDESPIRVLESEKKRQSHQGYQWVYHSPDKLLVIFHYRKGRGTNGPKEFLGNYQGYLQSDGLAVYDKIGKRDGIIQLGCLAHVRRKYHDSLQSDKARAQKALGYIKQIYDHDRLSLEAMDKTSYRTNNIKPIFQEWKEWVDKEAIKVLPKSPIGRAMRYTLSQWDKLENTLQQGRLKFDNNLIENKIRPLALGRKNYMFAGNHAAAQRIAMMYSFFGSCAAQGINPRNWLLNTLDVIAETKITDIEKLLPAYSD
jgi:transposase